MDLVTFQQLGQRALWEPDNADLFKTLLLHTEFLGNYAESRALYQRLAHRHPYSGYVWYNLGWTFIGLGEVQPALDAFEFAYIARPSFKEAYEAYAAWASLTGHARRAWLCYEEMMRHVEVDSHDLCRLSLYQRLCGNTEAARATCRRALTLDPFCAEASYQMAACLAHEGAYEKAIRWLRQAVRWEDNHLNAHQLLAYLYNQMGRPERAHSHAWRAVEQAPDDANAWINLLESLLLQEQYAEAIQIASVARLHVDTAELLYCAAACCFWAGRRQEAIAFLQEACRRAPHHAEQLFCWAPQLVLDREVQKVTRFYKP